MADAAYTLDTLGLPSTDPADRPPNPANDRAKVQFFSVGARNLPGHPTDNRWEQVRHLTGITFAAVRAKRTALAAAKLSVQEGRGSADGQDGDDEDWVPVGKSHPLAKALADPNPRHTLSDWLAHWVTQLDLTGSALTAVRGDRLGNPAQFWPLYTPHCQPVPMSPQYPWGGWRIQGWGWGPFGGVGYGHGFGAVLGGDEVLAHRYPHPEHAWDGYSPLTAGAKHLDVLEAIDESRKAVMDRGSRLDGILAVMGLVDDENAQKIRDRFEGRHGGSRNHGGVAVMSGEGEVKFLPITTTAKEMDFQAGWQQMVDAVLALFGVPPTVAGLKQNSSYAELYAAKQQFRDLTVQPLADMIGGFLTKHLAKRFYPDDNLRIVLELPPVGDHESKRADIAVSAGNVYTLNEARACLDLDPLDGGDVLASVYEQQQAQPPMGAPGQPGQPGDPAAGGDPSGGTLAPVGDAVLEALGVSGGGSATGAGGPPSGGGSATVAKAYPGTAHRGQPNNRGQFGPGGGGKTQPGAGQGTKPVMGNPITAGGPPPAGAAPQALPPLAAPGEGVHPQHKPRVLQAIKTLAGKAASLAAEVAAHAGANLEELVGNEQQWVMFLATQHTDAVMQALHVDHQTAFAILGHVAGHAMKHLKQHLGKGRGATAGAPNAGTTPAQGATPAPQAGPTAGAPPRPDNPAGEGSLPKRPERKALGEALDALSGRGAETPAEWARRMFAEHGGA